MSLLFGCLLLGVTSWTGIQRRCRLSSLSFWSVSGSWPSSFHRCARVCELSDPCLVFKQWCVLWQDMLYCIYSEITISAGIWVQWVVPAADPWTHPFLSVWKLPRQQSETERRVAVSPIHTQIVNDPGLTNAPYLCHTLWSHDLLWTATD